MITQNKDGSWNNGSCFGPTKTINIIKRENDVLLGESIENLKQRLKSFLSPQEEESLIQSSIDILKKCVDSSFRNISKKDNTGLVIGKIQSGKTLSFTSLIALARDNGYRVVIIISGRTNMLLGQTNKRLIEDLVSNDRNISIEKNVSDSKQKAISIKAITRKLRSKNDKLIILPVLKHQGRILNLKKIFKNQTIKDLLSMKSVLIIDDEADQASLNTEARNNEKYGLSNKSAIYSSIINLRYELPNHSFIQYTATPQGPLLINSLEVLSPDWHVLLTPGNKYTGGNKFFDGEYDIVKNIKNEGNYPPNIDHLTSPPESLVSTIIEFMILAVLMGDSDKKNKNLQKATMLIHPTWRVAETDETKGIESFYDWTENILEMCEAELEDGEFSMFEKEYNLIRERLEPKRIFIKFPTFEDVIQAIKENTFDDIRVHKVVGGMLEKGEEFPWDSCSFHILVGGQLLDRGFTVENLIMTYMPRDSKGSNQSDTIEQRCRFYGYRNDYLPFCRVYLNKNLISDFQSYNEFENELNEYLSNHSLDEFYKNGSRILMNKGLIPTNMSRISDKIISSHMKGSQYFHPQYPFLDENNSLISLFIKNIKNHKQYILQPKKKEHQKKNVTHRVTKIPFNKIIELLIQFKTNNLFEKLKL